MQRWARAIPGPGSGHFHNHYGYAYIEHGLFTEAEREFRAYIRVSPDEANAYDSLAELFLMTGRPALAVEHYDQALRLNPLFGWSHFGRAYALAARALRRGVRGLTTLQHLGPRAARACRRDSHARQACSARASGATRERRLISPPRGGSHAQFGDAGAAADADLFDAAVRRRARRACTRGRPCARRAAQPRPRMRRRHHARAPRGARASVARASPRRVPAESTLRAGRLDAPSEHSTPARIRIQVSWQHALAGEIALAEGRLDDAETAFRAPDTTSPRASRSIRRSSRSSTTCRSATALRAPRSRAAICGARSICTGG